jgi:1,2-diacylglycerol 3-beta-galactosyltransferase
MAATRRVPRILFLIADTGGGHRSAANAIRAAMALIAPETDLPEDPVPVRMDPAAFPFDPHEYMPAAWSASLRRWHAVIPDIFQECGLPPLRHTVNLYGLTVTTRPILYAGLWHATNTRATYAALAALNRSLMRGGLLRLLDRVRPDVIVSVHGLLTKPVLDVLHQMRVRVPIITVVTDLVRFHRAWATPDVNLCIVPTAAARDLTISMGMPAERIRLLGMPIHPKFCLPSNESEHVRAELGLTHNRFTVLLVGGGDGIGQLGDAARALAKSGLPIQLIVVTGRNRALQQALLTEQTAWTIPAAILGFVDTMPDIMRAADVIVTKAGPGTIAEALACGLPIILTGAIPGQEVGNIEYVESQGVGKLATTPEAITRAVQSFVEADPAEFAQCRAHARELSHPRAAFEIASVILGFVPTSRTPSIWDHIAPTRVPVRLFAMRRRRRAPGRQRAKSPRFTMPPAGRLQRGMPLFSRRRRKRV